MDLQTHTLEDASVNIEQVKHLLSVFLKCTADKMGANIVEDSNEETISAILLFRNLTEYYSLLWVALEKVKAQESIIESILKSAYTSCSNNNQAIRA